VIIQACVLHLESGPWLLAGFSFAILSFGYDMLVSMWIISGLSLSHLGMSICLFCLALMVIERYSSSFRKARLMRQQSLQLGVQRTRQGVREGSQQHARISMRTG